MRTTNHHLSERLPAHPEIETSAGRFGADLSVLKQQASARFAFDRHFHVASESRRVTPVRHRPRSLQNPNTLDDGPDKHLADIATDEVIERATDNRVTAKPIAAVFLRHPVPGTADRRNAIALVKPIEKANFLIAHYI
ncbi:hypothetical protein [Dechloromonas sp.]|uniref:hypothetical protein n=1 Tax=Dechloromonas sp. TaxID=1917218 RepID=UPI00121C0D81|nr:hypothetical protein [Dechloromonas sp.]MBU3697910.1 hypothetical protein [Dechloromonas sp.]TEX48098.1 MAG: hypothetical protein CFR70_07565 [Rhodocyclaceae bacterium]